MDYICPVKKLALLILVAMTISPDILQGQAVEEDYIRKNSFFVTWGYNRSHYNDTDIRFKGDDFDFKLEGVSAHDDPSPFEGDIYLNPLKFTIPQFDFRAGFFIGENTSISLGWDHMKYVVTRYQSARITGTISSTFSEDEAGTYNDQRFDLRPSFLQLEHTDGLNFVRAGVEHHGNFWNDKRNYFHLDAFLGAAAGPVITWTDTEIDGVSYRNWLHASGWGMSAQLGVRMRYKNIFFLQYQHQFGYMNLGDIIIMNDSPNRASHKIRFNEQSISIGAQLPIFIGGNPNK